MENKSESLTEGPSNSCTSCSENPAARGDSSVTRINSEIDLTRLTEGDRVGTHVAQDTKERQFSSFRGMNSRVHSAEDMFNTFLYWRPPLPDISQDLELLQSKMETHEENCSSSESLCNNCVASSEIKKVLQSLQEHMDDPDVQG